MWFKNLTIYKSDINKIKQEDLEQALANNKLLPCAKTENSSIGWLSPYGDKEEIYLHSCHGYWLFCFAVEERILPLAVIKEALNEKIYDIKTAEQREIYKKEKTRLKEEIIFSLLPKAFTKKIKTFAYIDSKNGYIFIDSNSNKKCEQIISLLRKTIGSLNCEPCNTKNSINQLLTNWLLQNSQPNIINIEDKCELVDTKQEGASIKLTNQDLSSNIIMEYIKQGAKVKQLAITWRDSLNFVLDDNFTYKQIRPTNLFLEKQKENNADSFLEKLDSDFSLLVLEFQELLADFLEMLGGIATIEDKKEKLLSVV